MIRWYVVQTQTHCELKAMQHLQRQGFDVYLPRYLKRRRHARRIETVAAPMFPRYVFVAIDTTKQRWLSIKSTVGVSRLVCNGDAPTPVPDAVIEAIRANEDSKGFVRLDERPRFNPGARVRITHGVFTSCVGLFHGMSEGERICVLLDLLGRKVRVTVDDLSVVAA